jgi:DNA polymerase III subunit epsilon
MKTRLIVIDTETGGLDPARHALLSVAAVDTEGQSFYSLVSPAPDWLIEPEALAVNGLSESFLREKGEHESLVMRDLAAWLKDRPGTILAGCNPAFDFGFLAAAANRQGIRWPHRRLLDLTAAAWAAYERGRLDLPIWPDGSPKLNLDSIAGALDLYRTGTTHNALEDALLTQACFAALATP